MISLLDKLIEDLKKERKELHHFSYHDYEYCQGKRNGIRLAINRLETLKGEIENENCSLEKD